MYKQPLLFIFFLLFTTAAYSQHENEPQRRRFNVGTFIGYGGASLAPIPTLDLRYKGTTLRLAPGYNYNGGGLVQELLPISKSFYNVYWIASAFYVQGTQSIHDNVLTDFKSVSVLGGLKYYMGTRFYSELQLGVEYRQKTTTGFSDDNKTSPYFEFGIGINLYRNYPKKEFIIDSDD